MKNSVEVLWKKLRERSLIDEAFDPSHDLEKDLGFDSLGRVELATLLEEEFGIRLGQTAIGQTKTASDVLKHLLYEVPILPRKKQVAQWSERLKDPPAERIVEDFCLKRGRIGKIFVKLIKLVVLVLLRLCFRLKITGVEKIPDRGPFLVCPNHQSFLDPLLLYALLPDETLYIAFEGSFRRPPLLWIVRFSRLLLTGQGGSVPECLKLAYEGLRRGMIVCVFPEGTRSKTNGLLKPRLGSGILSCEASAPILPVLIHGATGVFSPHHPGFRFCKIKLEIGEPIFPPTDQADPPTNYQRTLELWTQAILQMQDNRTVEVSK